MDITRRRVSNLKHYFVISIILLAVFFIFAPTEAVFAQEKNQKSEASITFKKVHQTQPDGEDKEDGSGEVSPGQVSPSTPGKPGGKEPLIPDGPEEVGQSESGQAGATPDKDKGAKLPKTATNVFNLSLLAILIIVLGSILYYQTRKEKQEVNL